MIFLLVITFLLVLTTLIHKHRKAGKTVVPPGPPGLPLIGNLHQLSTASSPHIYLWQLSKKYGPLMHMKLGSTPALVISSAKLAEEVLKTKDSSFCSRTKHMGQQKLSYNWLDIAFSPHGDHWREVKKILSIHLFSPRKIQSFRPIRKDEISRMIREVSESASSGLAVNLSEMAMNLFITLICRIACGKRSNRGVDELLREVQAMIAAFFVSDYFPLLQWVDKLSGLVDRLETIAMKMDTFYQELIEEHLDPKREKKSNEENDILDVLIRLRQDRSCSIDLSWDHIKALLLDTFIGGTGTSATSVVWTMMAIMKKPNVMKKLQAEVRGMITQKTQVDEDDLAKLPYLKAVISESLRLYPPAPLLVQRQTIDKCMLESYEIQPNTMVYINAWAIGRDPEYWENPQDFFPERFLDNSVSLKGQDFGLIPFGSGRRICPGMPMGLVNVELTVANLVYSFNWEFPPNVSPENVEEDGASGFANQLKNPLVLVPKKIVV